MKNDFESKFREWWDLVWKNHIELSPGDFDCIEEIDLFLEDPDECLKEERKYEKEMDEEMNAAMEEDIKSGKFNPETGEVKE
jgi:hypothetical protein